MLALKSVQVFNPKYKVGICKEGAKKKGRTKVKAKDEEEQVAKRKRISRRKTKGKNAFFQIADRAGDTQVRERFLVPFTSVGVFLSQSPSLDAKSQSVYFFFFFLFFF